MCTLTQRELDFLARLKTGWWRLYRRELMRLLEGGASHGDAPSEAPTTSWHVLSG